MEGVIIISEMFLESVREYLPVLRKSNEVDPERKQKIHAQLKAVLDTCHKEYLVDNERGVRIGLFRRTSGKRTLNSSSKS